MCSQSQVCCKGIGSVGMSDGQRSSFYVGKKPPVRPGRGRRVRRAVTDHVVGPSGDPSLALLLFLEHGVEFKLLIGGLRDVTKSMSRSTRLAGMMHWLLL